VSTVHDFAAARIDGTQAPLSEWAGKVLLVVNTASQCGFTPQYAGLQELHQRYAPQGFAVLGFPCNQFGGQEPGSEGQIATFCETSFGVTFPMFAKVEVNGSGAHPLWKHLTSTKPGLLGSEAIKWNFTKFLVDRQGRVIARYAPTTKPADIAADVERALGA
jgi:glutathione peroxidase